ncbi:hypothetical protein [Bacillus sp. T3]|uniref:hypothetical protein n=1 Tax=Bacillus sp. T3 TaxID=467262 RepID=UPI00298284D2|nr:hypothetical protein [Bacillus sp. T3]
MTTVHHFQAFEDTVRHVLQNAISEKDIVKSLTPYFRSFLEKEGLVPEEIKQPKSPGKIWSISPL